jgi:hypothetical protein
MIRLNINFEDNTIKMQQTVLRETSMMQLAVSSLPSLL